MQGSILYNKKKGGNKYTPPFLQDSQLKRAKYKHFKYNKTQIKLNINFFYYILYEGQN
jgi:hypothetical protein